MKEIRYFYSPDPTSGILPEDEAPHALKVLRLSIGDNIMIIDGKGNVYNCVITQASKSQCSFAIKDVQHVAPQWSRHINLAIAPTKNIDRIEWLVEKATEIGVDQIDFISCQFSERKIIKKERLEKIAISAAKQSHKFYKPTINELTSFKSYIETPFDGTRYIAHCYNDVDLRDTNASKRFLLSELLSTDTNMQVLIGPEGDFSIEEVKLAVKQGALPVTLGESRLRTETAGLVAVHLMQLAANKDLFTTPKNNKELHTFTF